MAGKIAPSVNKRRFNRNTTTLWRARCELDHKTGGFSRPPAEREIKVSYFAVWHFLEHEGTSFKKEAAPNVHSWPTLPIADCPR